jgi:hypothetical protein
MTGQQVGAYIYHFKEPFHPTFLFLKKVLAVAGRLSSWWKVNRYQ